MIDWSDVDTVLLDMDGTLLDLEFDNVLWNQLLPRRYAAHHGLTAEAALAALEAHLAPTRHTITYYCLDHWAQMTQLDILALHRQLVHLIRFRPSAKLLLNALRSGGKRLVLVTNAHRDSFSIKDEVTGLASVVDRVVSSHDFAAAKESQTFWRQLADTEPFDPARTLLIDDTPRVLAAAERFGVRHLLGIAQPDSGQPPLTDLVYRAVGHFDELMP